jgi:YidC/Oxa1 family membrane protein insertase
MIDFLVGIGSAIMTPLYYVTSAILVAWHWMFTQLGMDTDSGYTWVLSIVGLTVTIRALLIPLFVRQIKSSRNMQLLQPRVKELQKKYGHDRERLGQETMKLYKESGTNPFASCLPLILQAPIFLALFRLLDNAAHGKPKGILTQKHADSLRDAEFLGAQIADTFTGWLPDYRAGEAPINVGVLTVFLVLSMVATTFITQRQLMRKNMPAAALTGQYAQQQKLLLYVLPVVFAVGGIAFPSASSCTGRRRTCGPWASSSTSSATTPHRARPRSRPSRSATASTARRSRWTPPPKPAITRRRSSSHASSRSGSRARSGSRRRRHRVPAPATSSTARRSTERIDGEHPSHAAQAHQAQCRRAQCRRAQCRRPGANKSAAGKPSGSRANPNRSRKKRPQVVWRHHPHVVPPARLSISAPARTRSTHVRGTAVRPHARRGRPARARRTVQALPPGAARAGG